MFVSIWYCINCTCVNLNYHPSFSRLARSLGRLARSLITHFSFSTAAFSWFKRAVFTSVEIDFFLCALSNWESQCHVVSSINLSVRFTAMRIKHSLTQQCMPGTTDVASELLSDYSFIMSCWLIWLNNLPNLAKYSLQMRYLE